MHPLHSNQVFVADIAPNTTCGDPILQFSWQDADRTGREEVAQTIASVEARVMDYLNFAMRPTYFASVEIPYPQPSSPDLFNTGPYDIRSMYRSMRLPKGYIIGPGKEAFSLLDSAATIVWSDTNGDGYFETGTVVVSNIDILGNVVTDPSDVSVYYPGQGSDDAWEIRPVTTTIDPIEQTATCVFHREQCVDPDLMFGFDVRAVDGLDDTQFLTTVGVYHHWLDYKQPSIQFRWNDVGWMLTPQTVQYSTQDGSFLIANAELGWIQPQAAHWDSTSEVFVNDVFSVARGPDTLRAWFKAGYPLDSKGNMAGVWERIIAYLTLAELDRPLCQCKALGTFTEYWSWDFSLNTPNNNQQISRRKLDCPIGTTRAALFAWEQILRYRLPDDAG